MSNAQDSGKIKLAIVGCGGMSHAHASHLKQIPEAQVVALCDIKAENMDKLWKEKFAAADTIRRYDSLEQLCQDPPADLRGVVIVTPHTLHIEQSIKCLEHGWDVLVEKPMVTSSADAQTLAEKIKSTGRHFQIAFQSPFSAEFAYIRHVILQGDLGELQTITAHSCQSWKPFTTGTWRQDPKLSGGGQMYDTGAHLFNAIAWLIDRPVIEVFCWADNKGTPVDINAVMTIRWGGAVKDGVTTGGDVMGSVTISGNTPGWQEGIWLCGDKGRIVTGIHGGRLEHYDEHGQLIKYPPVTQPGYTPIQNFVLCLRGQAEPRCPVRYGILHSWLMDALYESVREKKAVKVGKPPI